MTRILAIETSSAACSAALLDGDSLSYRHELAPRQHARLILPMVELLLSEAGIAAQQLDACAFGRGPGSFTGVRIAASVIQGIAYAAVIPVVPVSTLAALALGAMRTSGQQQVLAALDARKAEVYFAACRQDESGLPQVLGDEQVCTPAGIVIPPGHHWVGAGSGWDSYADELAAVTGEQVTEVLPQQEPHAVDVAHIARAMFARGESVPPEQAIPVYLRNNVADAKKPGTYNPGTYNP